MRVAAAAFDAVGEVVADMQVPPDVVTCEAGKDGRLARGPKSPSEGNIEC
jgi:hypothetical protein